MFRRLLRWLAHQSSPTLPPAEPVREAVPSVSDDTVIPVRRCPGCGVLRDRVGVCGCGALRREGRG
jgi:hypothetical protein